MAFEADCRVSTVLDEFRVATAPRHPFVWRLTALATTPSATAPRRLLLPGAAFEFGDVKFEIRNPKSEIVPC